jgi:ADP-ribosylglycohydrolase
MQALLNGKPYTETGTMQYVWIPGCCVFFVFLSLLMYRRFKDGSWANGGPMRIAAVGIAFRNATDDELYEAVRQALLATHVHVDSVDAAFIVCKAISMAMHHPAEAPIADFDVVALLQTLLAASKSKEMKEHIQIIIDHRLDQFESLSKELEFHRMELADEFQIVAVEAVSVVLWTFVRHFALSPSEMITKVIGYGGDTDTTACILGSIVGALHGTHWMPHHWYDDLENEEWGRDYCVELGRGLAKLDLHGIITPEN